MRWHLRTPVPPGQRPNWRQYQATLQRNQPGRQLKHWRHIIAAAALVGLLLYLVIPGNRPTDVSPTDAALLPAESNRELMNRQEARQLLERIDPANFSEGRFTVPFKETQACIQTTLDEGLQSRLTGALDRKNSRYVGIIVMEAVSGRVLAMVGYDKTATPLNPCLSNKFPAASIFKIVTAAAAVEHCGFTSETPLYFNGYKHTLYKRQLVEKKDRWTNEIAFKDSFAQSVNPVFGKLGALRLGQPILEEYAGAFGFNQPIAFELFVEPSRITIDDDPYHLAEIASGFNNDTTISPLHGAMIAASILNEGRIIVPTIVERIVDPEGTLLYRSEPVWQAQAMSPETAATLARLMETTIRSGTARRTFRGLRPNPKIGALTIGGKTGSIDNRQNDARFDWFVGYAQDQRQIGRLALAVVVAHEKFIGTRAAQYARMAITHYFNQLGAEQAVEAGS